MAKEPLSDWYLGALHALDQSYPVFTPTLQIMWTGSRRRFDKKKMFSKKTQPEVRKELNKAITYKFKWHFPSVKDNTLNLVRQGFSYQIA